MIKKDQAQYQIIVMGTSSGGLIALKTILGSLAENFPLPILIVQHIGYEQDDFLANYLNEKCRITVKEGVEQEIAQPGCAYVAPSDYHLLIEADLSLVLSSIEKVNFARPSIDVLFESAAYALGKGVMGVLLTGANQDGSRGIKTIKEYGGYTIVQDPETAYADTMPRAAIKASVVDQILPLERIGEFLSAFFNAD